MNDIHGDNATCWRDLADRPTPDEIASFERMERDGVPDEDPALGGHAAAGPR
jgi:hypothetical protein